MEKILNTNQYEHQFRNYEIAPRDSDIIENGIVTVYESGLIDPRVFDTLRIVTFDAKNFYIYTKGVHVSTPDILVRTESRENGFSWYIVNHNGEYGTTPDYYKGGKSWLLNSAIESTADESEKSKNYNKLIPTYVDEPDTVLDVIAISPYSAFEKVQGESFDYQTHVLFHEVAHIEERIRLNKDHENVSPFLPGGYGKFIAAIKMQNPHIAEICENDKNILNHRTMGELYPIVVEIEAQRLYAPDRYNEYIAKCEMICQRISEFDTSTVTDDAVQSFLQDPYKKAYLIQYLIRSLHTDFVATKNFLFECLS